MFAFVKCVLTPIYKTLSLKYRNLFDLQHENGIKYYTLDAFVFFFFFFAIEWFKSQHLVICSLKVKLKFMTISFNIIAIQAPPNQPITKQKRTNGNLMFVFVYRCCSVKSNNIKLINQESKFLRLFPLKIPKLLHIQLFAVFLLVILLCLLYKIPFGLYAICMHPNRANILLQFLYYCLCFFILHTLYLYLSNLYIFRIWI